jgi:DNA-binding IclR family transcriptional regulator
LSEPSRFSKYRESDAPLGLAEICQRMGLHKSTAHRSLMVLERSSLIERTQDNRFRLGLKLYELGNRAMEQIDLRSCVQPFFRRLSMQAVYEFEDRNLQPGLLHRYGKGDACLSARGDD